MAGPPQQNDNYQWIQIKDFSPGISDNPGANYPAGAAQRDATFRCIANRNGALIPLPARTVPLSLPNDNGATPIDGHYGLVGLYVPPIPVLPTVLAFNPNLFPEHELFVGNEWLNGTTRHQRLRRYRRYEGAGTTGDLIKDVSAADASIHLTPNGMGFGSTRSNRASPTTPGVPVTIAMWVFGSTFNYLTEFPDDQSTAVNTPFDIFTNSVFLLGIVCHQGRTAAQEATAYGQGVNTTTFMGENLIWSNVNDVTAANWNTATPQVFVPENPSGFAFLCSMSANELFAPKINGGMFVTGDLFNPTVTTLPMVVGSEVSQTPAVTGAGVVYGNGNSGIWVWGHGDTSNLLSPQMTPNFWLLNSTTHPEFDVFGGVRYQFSRSDEWVLISNNWLYDLNLNSWWRLEDPNVTQIRMFTTISRFIYGSASFYTNAAPTPISMWERNVPALSYSWQSHPQWDTVDNLVDIREVAIRAQGVGTITVTLTGESSTSTIQFQIENSLPILVRQPIRIQDANIAVTLVSSSAVEAPTIHECNLGYFSAQKETNRV
jgi:hypothetical protein